MLYSCIHMTTVGTKWLTNRSTKSVVDSGEQMVPSVSVVVEILVIIIIVVLSGRVVVFLYSLCTSEMLDVSADDVEGWSGVSVLLPARLHCRLKPASEQHTTVC